MIHSNRDGSACRAGGLTQDCRRVPTTIFRGIGPFLPFTSSLWHQTVLRTPPPPREGAWPSTPRRWGGVRPSGKANGQCRRRPRRPARRAPTAPRHRAPKTVFLGDEECGQLPSVSRGSLGRRRPRAPLGLSAGAPLPPRVWSTPSQGPSSPFGHCLFLNLLSIKCSLVYIFSTSRPLTAASHLRHRLGGA